MDQQLQKFIMANGLLSILAHLCRGLLLLIPLAFSISALTYIYNPHILSRTRDSISTEYFRKYIMRNEMAAELIETGKTKAAFNILQENIREMGKVRKLDRLYDPYATTLQNLLHMAKIDNNKAIALEATRKLVDLDSKNVNFLIEHSSVLLSMGNIPEAESFLIRANRLSPTLPEPVEQLSSIYVKTGHKEKAIELLESFLDANRHLYVQLNLIGHQNGNSKVTLAAQPLPVTGTKQKLRLSIHGSDVSLSSNENLQLYITGGNMLLMKLFRITAMTPIESVIVAPDALQTALSGAERINKVEYLLKGSSTSITFSIPDNLGNKELKELSFELEFRPIFSPLMQRIYGEAT